ncbi:MAG: hypothetical protein Q4G26_08120 [Paracoccus sp. (in: a-proteobacteria)]|nr:hypothetical protein [Paracoccus sp. (in: a-proteobacteria)]
MSKKADMLVRLAQLARIRSDSELKRFAAYRNHVDRLSAQQADHRARLGQLFADEQEFSVAATRMASLDAGRLARELSRLDAEMTRLRPGFDAARARAMREFGRVRVLESLSETLRAEARKKKNHL